MSANLVGTSRLDGALQLIGVLFIFLFVLLVTYFVTKWIAGYQKQQLHNRNLQIVETLKVSPNKYIQIVKAGEEYLVVGMGKDEMVLLTKLSKTQVDLDTVESSTFTDTLKFHDILEKTKKHFESKK